MKKKLLFIIIIIIIGIVIFTLFVVKPKNIGSYYSTQKVTLKNNQLITETTLYSNYKTFSNQVNSDISENDFKNSNYLLLPVKYDPCSEEDLKIEDYNINNNTANIEISYKAKCGVCAPDYEFFILKLAKNIKKTPTVDIEYKSRNKVHCNPNVAYKPMIYLYPENMTDVNVLLGNEKSLTTTYPKYNDGWKITAYPDGTLIDDKGRQYYGLYWEGNNYQNQIQDTGFVIPGNDTISFLEDKLKVLGLTEKEANEFIVYWLPKLEKNKYNYIYFESLDNINNYMPLSISPEPDSIIRILMNYKPLNKKISVNEQILNTPDRTGFTVVEWGGSIIN